MLMIAYLQYVIRALIVAGAEGAAAPVDFEQWVHAPVNFDQWAHSPDNFQ